MKYNETIKINEEVTPRVERNSKYNSKKIRTEWDLLHFTLKRIKNHIFT